MNPYKKIYISLATFGAIILLFLFLVYLPWAAQIKKSAEDLIFQKEAFFSLKESQEALEKLRKDFINLKPEVEKIEDLFLESENPVEFLNYLEETALSSGILIQTSALSFGGKNNGAFPYLSLQVSFKSHFFNFSKFLDRLENSSFMLEIQNLNVRKIGDEVSVSFPLKVFTK